VVDAEGFVDAGPWGDVMTGAAQGRGLKGLVIDGSVRDSATIIGMGFPVFARGVCIKGTNKCQPGKVGIPIVLGGVQVRPGDIIVGDRDGLVLVLLEEVAEVIAACADREHKEAAFREQLASGKTTVELLGLQDRLKSFGMN
jgi:4-hydroxy-4-methyl-2-oxoglutarate aldolase